MKRSRWLLLGMAAVVMVGMFAVPASAAKTLTFLTQPAHAVKNQTITNVQMDAADGTLNGALVQVLAGANTRVTLTSAPASSLSRTVRADGDGVATFSGISIGTPGTYSLVASANSFDSATSNSFLIFDSGEACSGNAVCDPATGALTNAGMIAQAAGRSAAGGIVGMGLDIQSAPVCPGDDPALFNHGPSVVTAFWDGIDGEVVVTLTISKAWDQLQANNGASFYQVCFTYDIAGKTFTDRFGNVVEVGLLPDCAPGQGPPCVQSRTKDRKGNVKIVIRSLSDPKIR